MLPGLEVSMVPGLSEGSFLVGKEPREHHEFPRCYNYRHDRSSSCLPWRMTSAKNLGNKERVSRKAKIDRGVIFTTVDFVTTWSSSILPNREHPLYGQI